MILITTTKASNMLRREWKKRGTPIAQSLTIFRESKDGKDGTSEKKERKQKGSKREAKGMSFRHSKQKTLESKEKATETRWNLMDA